MKTLFHVRDFGANAVAYPAEQLSLTHLRYKWLQFAPGITATIYHKREGGDYDSTGIQAAIDAAHAAGGGTVLVPAGDYLIKPIILKSRVNLHLEPGAHLWGTPILEDLLLPDSRRPLVSAEHAEDFSITGFGQISGQSPKWVIPWMNSRPAKWITTERGGNVLRFEHCRNVVLDGILVKDSSSWSVVFKHCDHVRIDGLRIEAFDVTNCDGIDLSETSNATVSNCRLWVTDDGIVLKNFTPGHTMRNITVTNCVIRTLCNGVKIGTETVGNFEDITVTNCVIANPATDIKRADAGVSLCAVDGGTVRNLNISNLVMRNVDCPFYFVAAPRERYQSQYRPPRPGKFENISLTNIQAEGVRFTSFISGARDATASGIYISNVRVMKAHDFRKSPVETPVPEARNQYPNPFMFASPDGGRQGIGDGLPAFGLYLRHAEDVTVRDFTVTCAQADGREFIVQEDCRDVLLENVKARNADTQGSWTAEGVRGILFDMDGVLIDSEPIHAESTLEMMRRMGATVEEGADFSIFRGTTEPTMAARLKEMYPHLPHSVQDIVSLKVDIYEEMFAKVPLIEGAREFAHRCREAGFKLGLATSAVRSSQLLTFQTFHLAECFEAITTGEDVEHSKPNPEPYLRTAALLGLEAAECVVIEDSINGVKAGKSAGCRVIGLTTSHSVEELLAAGADFAVDTYREIEDLLGLSANS